MLTISRLIEERKLAPQKFNSVEYTRHYIQSCLDQMDEEEKDLYKNFACESKDKLNHLELNMSSLDVETFSRLVSENFMNPNIMKSVSCVMKNIKLTGVPQNLVIKEYFNNIRQIGAPSVYGTVLTEDFTKDHVKFAKNFAVIKIAQTPESIPELVHEIFVSKNYINKLRESGNFNWLYAYDTFKCSVPYISSSGKECLAFCTNNNKTVPHFMTEMIYPGTPLLNQIPILSAEELLILFMQLILSIEDANTNHNFQVSHGDLHLNNVLMRKVPNGYSTLYKRKGNNIQLKGIGLLGVIIDYGSLMVKDSITGKYYSKIIPKSKEYYEQAMNNKLMFIELNEEIKGWSTVGVVRNTIFPLADAHQILVSIYITLVEAKNPNYKYFEPLLDFFYANGDLGKLYRNSNRTKEENNEFNRIHKLPIFPEYMGVEPYIKFVDFCIDKLKTYGIFDVSPDTKILSCENCSTYESIMAEIGIDINEFKPNLKTFSEFINAYKYLNNDENYHSDVESEKSRNLDKLFKKFDIKAAKHAFFQIKTPPNVQVIPIKPERNDVTDLQKYFKEYKKNSDDIALFLDRYEFLKGEVKEVIDVANLFKKYYNYDIFNEKFVKNSMDVDEHIDNKIILKYNKLTEDKEIIKKQYAQNLTNLNIIKNYSSGELLKSLIFSSNPFDNDALYDEFYTFYYKKYFSLVNLF